MEPTNNYSFFPSHGVTGRRRRRYPTPTRATRAGARVTTTGATTVTTTVTAGTTAVTTATTTTGATVLRQRRRVAPEPRLQTSHRVEASSSDGCVRSGPTPLSVPVCDLDTGCRPESPRVPATTPCRRGRTRHTGISFVKFLCESLPTK